MAITASGGTTGGTEPPITPATGGSAGTSGGSPPPAGMTGGSAGSAGATGGAGGMVAIDSGVDSGAQQDASDVEDPLSFAGDLHELFIHDACTADYPPQPDTCLHAQETDETITFGGQAGTVYDVTLRVRGLLEPTTINGGATPLPAHPYFKVGGTVVATDYSQWHIEVSDPPQTYWLNHYPSTSHTIYKQDFEAVLAIAGGAEVVVRVIDGNDRQIDNAEMGPADRRQVIEGVTAEVLDGQVLRLDVIAVQAQ